VAKVGAFQSYLQQHYGVFWCWQRGQTIFRSVVSKHCLALCNNVHVLSHVTSEDHVGHYITNAAEGATWQRCACQEIAVWLAQEIQTCCSVMPFIDVLGSVAKRALMACFHQEIIRKPQVLIVM
jgi:hypothetical protein